MATKTQTKAADRKKTKARKPWRAFSQADYVERAAALVTHTFKGVNTNIKPGGGVRTKAEFDSQFPYACTRFASESVPLTYASNATESVLTEQVCAVLEDGVSAGLAQFEAVPPEEVAWLRERITPMLHEPATVAPASVNMRLRQILLDDGRGGDICISPLPSGGMSWRIQRLLEHILQRRAQHLPAKARRPLGVDFVYVKVGGDKAQNAGRIQLIGAMQQAYRFSVPQGTTVALRAAFAFHHRGVSLAPSPQLVRESGRWLQALRQADSAGSVLSRSGPRMEREADIVHQIVDNILQRGERARVAIEPFVGTVFAALCAESLPEVVRGVIDLSRRDAAWRDAFAETVAQGIAAVKDNDGMRLAGISGASASSLKAYIAEAL
ncbi:hypothetical protein GALL_297520 [mine drainage metagenome]|uniref:Uncharacterized protein n=1 Tax=mine drainage metagenome TaxID=410659 RepID=A0A1J5QYL5_9ZZZZ